MPSAQTVIALTMVALCAVWLGFLAWRKFRKGGGCGCESCPARRDHAPR